MLLAAALMLWVSLTNLSWGRITIGVLGGFSLFALPLGIGAHLPAARQKAWRVAWNLAFIASAVAAYFVLGFEGAGGVFIGFVTANLASGWTPRSVIPREESEAVPAPTFEDRRLLVTVLVVLSATAAFDFLSRPPGVPEDWHSHQAPKGEWSFRYPPSWTVQSETGPFGEEILLTDSQDDIDYSFLTGSWSVLEANDPDLMALSFQHIPEPIESLANTFGGQVPEASFPLSLGQTFEISDPPRFGSAQPQPHLELLVPHNDDLYGVTI